MRGNRAVILPQQYMASGKVSRMRGNSRHSKKPVVNIPVVNKGEKSGTKLLHPPSVQTLRKRLAHVQRCLKVGVKLLVVVKNVYDAVAWAKALDRADSSGIIHGYGFECANDAMHYRQQAVSSKKEVLVLYTVAPHIVGKLAATRIDVSVPGVVWLKQAQKHLKKRSRLGIHLWVDTGMGRDGPLPSEMTKVAAYAKNMAQSGLVQVKGIMSHLCCTMYTSSTSRGGDSSLKGLTDLIGSQGVKKFTHLELTNKQIARFEKVISELRQQKLLPVTAIRHIGSSGAVSKGMTGAMFDMVRVGRMLVDGDSDGAPLFKVKQIVREASAARQENPAQCSARVATVKTLPAKWCVGYGCEKLPHLQALGRLKTPKRVALIQVNADCPKLDQQLIVYFVLQEECPEGGKNPNYGLGGAVVKLHGHTLKILANHGSCGVVIEAPDKADVEEGTMVKLSVTEDFLRKKLLQK